MSKTRLTYDSPLPMFPARTAPSRTGAEDKAKLEARVDKILEMLGELLSSQEDVPADHRLSVPFYAEGDAPDSRQRQLLAAVLKRLRPAVAKIKDPADKARVTDALLSAVRGSGVASAMDAARLDTYEQMCAEAESAYAARNPHNKKEG